MNARKPAKRSRRWIDWLVTVPPLSWWLRQPVSRAAFLLTAAYLIRDRDVKLRIYPGIAPVMILPFIFLFQRHNGPADFYLAFSGAYLGLIPLLALGMLKYSQQWQASDIFRSAPMAGPAEICHGARRAVLCFLTLPILVVTGTVILLVHGPGPQLLLLLPGLVVLPVYALIPGLIGKAIPLSSPIEEGKSAGRGLTMMLVMFLSLALSGVAEFSASQGWLWPFLAAETVVVIIVYAAMRFAFKNMRWDPAE